MARKPQRPAAPRRSRAPAAAAGETDREKIIAAFMALLAEKRFEEIGFGDIAARAGVSLAELRGEFSSTLAILAAHMKETRPHGARPAATPTWPRSRRASGCSTC